MKVGQILKQKGSGNFSISPDQLLTEAAALMSEHRIGSLVIFEGQRPVSIVTERDIMLAVTKYGSDLNKAKVNEVMASKLIVCDAEASLDDAMDLMMNNATGHRIRHLTVLDGEAFVGVISIGDVVSALLTKTEFENKLLKNYIKNWPDEEEV